MKSFVVVQSWLLFIILCSAQKDQRLLQCYSGLGGWANFFVSFSFPNAALSRYWNLERKCCFFHWTTLWVSSIRWISARTVRNTHKTQVKYSKTLLKLSWYGRESTRHPGQAAEPVRVCCWTRAAVLFPQPFFLCVVVVTVLAHGRSCSNKAGGFRNAWTELLYRWEQMHWERIRNLLG